MRELSEDYNKLDETQSFKEMYNVENRPVCVRISISILICKCILFALTEKIYR